MIPLLPLFGAALMLLIGKSLPRSVVNLICCGVMAAAFALSLIVPRGTFEIAQWLPGIGADWAFLLDDLSVLMMRLVTGVGLLIHVYSIGYMEHDKGYYRYFGYLNLFVFFMLLLVMSDNFALTFAGWEGVGLASYLLIGFYFDRKSAGDAANKAFIVNRVGDCGYLLAMFAMLSVAGSLKYSEVFARVDASSATLIAALLFVAACGKSAQFPLYVWLPDAMEGPTPVSALIHAATMVTAGIYIIARSQAIFSLAPDMMPIIATLGAITALLAATVAMVQHDIKCVLAYSTVSQLGLMFVALGVGAYQAAVFHLFTHAFFKALLFLCAGAVIHALDGEQDMRKMGGLRKNFPFAFWMMVIGTLAIAGIPALSGFISKDDILWEAFRYSTGLWVMGITTSLLTAFYMWRLIEMTFLEESHHGEPHTLPYSMQIPLVILAIGSIFAGWAPLRGPKEHGGTLEYVLMAAATGAALLGIWLAHKRINFLSPFHFLFKRRWYLDEALFAVFVRGFAQGGGSFLAAVDRNVIDGGVNAAGFMTRQFSRLSIFWDTWVIDGLVRVSGLMVKLSSYPVRVLQTGSVQSYALMILAGVAIFLGWALTK